MNALVNSFHRLDLEQLKTLPRNLIHILLRIISKRGYLTDQNIHVVKKNYVPPTHNQLFCLSNLINLVFKRTN